MQGIKNIIFDFGNVLFDLQLGRIRQSFEQHLGENAAAVRDKLLAARVFELYETGGLDTAEFVAAVRFACDQRLTEQQITTAWNSIFVGMPRERFELLSRLRERYNVFMLSNINDLHARWVDEYMVREHGFEDFQTRFFDGVYYSHLIRLRKPDREAFEYVLADAELAASETIFFDDLEVNVEAARSVGIEGILHPPGADIVGICTELFGPG